MDKILPVPIAELSIISALTLFLAAVGSLAEFKRPIRHLPGMKLNPELYFTADLDAGSARLSR